MTPEMNAQIGIWRQKALDGTLTIDEMKQAIAALRGDRKEAAVASDKSRKVKAKSVIPDANDLLAELDGL